MAKKSVTEIAEIDTKVVKMKTTNAQKAADALDIKTNDDMTVAGTLLKGITLTGKYIKQEKDKQLNPAKATVDSIKNFWAPFENATANAQTTVKKKMEVFAAQQYAIERDQQRKADEEATRLAKEVEAGKISLEEASVKQEETQANVAVANRAVETKRGEAAASIAMIDKLDIFDQEAIPHEYWVVDEVKLRNALKGGVVVPGAKLIKVPNIRAR